MKEIVDTHIINLEQEMFHQQRFTSGKDDLNLYNVLE